MMEEYQDRLKKAKNAIDKAEFVLIGAGAGLSAAAGLDYAGKRFTENFADFIEKYGVKDMYTATFYPFQTEEEEWAHWARHIDVNRFTQPATDLYKALLRLIAKKEYFVITTNVEAQFAKAGFQTERIFATQGDYAYLQCAKGCHDKLYYNEPMIEEMLLATKDCKIPTKLVPKCPVCGNPMAINLRKDECFVQDEAWYHANDQYAAFLQKTSGKRIVLLELGVGYNTPGIIRYPFEQMTYRNQNAMLIRMNKDYPAGTKENVQKTIAFNEDINQITQDLLA
jgi:NAD-dependent SIR2 family protein deacetylase